MCGICGFVGPPQPELLRGMTWDLRSRGPDASGVYESPAASLGHRRLSIIDLEGGDQPMRDAAGQRVLVYNGELYNYRELRAELMARGRRFRTQSDTEVVLEALAEWGLEALPRFEGIFAFAAWEPERRRLWLARDALGVKPLRYRQTGEAFYFASETRALFRTPGFERRPTPGAIERLLAFRYDPADQVFRDATPLPPGHTLELVDGRLSLRRYWSPPPGPAASGRSRLTGLLGEVAGFRQRLDQAVQRQLVADVPVGLFLSGGLDSSALLEAISRLGARDQPLRTFSIGFGTERDEVAKAEGLARRFGAQHQSFELTPGEFLEDLPRVFQSFDEPVLDPVQVAVWKLAQLASREVKVVLSGEGADEIMAGYVHHRSLGWAGLVRRLTPGLARELLAQAVSVAPAALLDAVFPYPARLGAGGREKLIRLVRSLGSPLLTYLEAATLFGEDERRALYTSEFAAQLPGSGAALRAQAEPRFAAAWDGSGEVARLLRYDLGGWLPGNVLNRLDRLTMAHGLEARVPFLDRDLLAFSLTSRFTGPPFPNKLLLRLALAGRLPARIVSQPKQSFHLPLDETAGDSLAALVGDVLSPAAVAARGIVRPEAVAALSDPAARRDLVGSKRLFALFALELWWREVLDPEPLPVSARGGEPGEP